MYNIPSPSEIKKKSLKLFNSSKKDIVDETIDKSKPFVHEHFTLLYYTPYYEKLSYEQKLKYNQLCGVMINELFMFLEESLINKSLIKLKHHPDIVDITDLSDCITGMIKEEEKHHKLFKKLNRICFPEIYQNSVYNFILLKPWEKKLFNASLNYPATMSFFIWLILTLEEFSLTFSTALLKNKNTENLGELDHYFTHIHALHLRDEINHTYLDMHLINACFVASNPILKKVNTILFKNILKLEGTLF